MRVAGIDCGTNSVRLLIAEGAPGAAGSAAGEFTALERALHLTRLGQGVDRTGRFADDALARTLDAVADFAGRIRAAGVERVRFVATSAARDAANREAFFAGVREHLGVEAEIISGAEEARLSFDGALSGVRAVDWPVLVMDIGGGSTELVLGEQDASGEVQVLAATSMDVGSVRIRERFLHSDPPADAERAAAAGYVDGLIAASGVDVAAARTWIGVGGTATTLSALHQGLPAYDRDVVHGSVMARSDLAALADRLLATPVPDVLRLPSMQPKRADVICAGALIASRVGAVARVDLTVSESDILDGVVLGLLAPQRATPTTSRPSRS